MKKHYILNLFILLLSSLSCAQQTEKEEKPPYVILISFDGFRHDYVEKYDTPNFKALIKDGVAAQAMLPSYPSKTFPNHYTIVTGMYPDNHGLVDNSFYDANLDLSYSIRDREVVENPAFYGGLPLWQLVQQNNMKSASYFWVGSETSIAGSYPNYYHIYDGDIPNDERVNAVIAWLKLPESERPNFISLYFSLVDSAGHSFGPNGEKTKEAVLEADRLLGLLMSLVDQIDLPINIVVTSDHGMNEITPEEDSYITVPDLLEGIDSERVRFVSNGAHGHFYSEDMDYLKEVASELRARETSTNYEVFFKSEMPEHWHYGTHDRIGNLFIKMNPGHYLTSPQRKSGAIENQSYRGEHGFDPDETIDMGAIFYAKGPSFKSGLKIEKFRNIHVYPMIANVLGITSLPKIDGKLEVLKPILK
ncbi:ectonucleotide pyrophosphatase/phosphodiesterase [Roseivirga sp.]|uniref:alkaline phosphatase family protein n=1 Tax=Roseivirga sp. TaxID=1964215 RepID=UPI003B8B91B5